MLALRPAFQATERGCLIKQIIHEDPPPLRRIDRRIPRDLETIVLKATEKDPNRRYGRADELAEDLRRYLAYLPIQARRSSLPVRLARWCRRNPAVATLTFCVGALLIVLAVGGTVAAVNMRINLNRAELAERDLTSGIQELQATQQRLELSLDRVRDAEHEKTQRLFDSLVSGARASRWSGRTGQRFGSLQSLAEAAQLVAVLELGNDASRSLRNEAIACMALADAKITQEWVAIPPRHAEILQFDQKMQRYARSDLQGTISVRSVAGDQEIAQLPGSGSQAVFLLFSPGGDRLAAKYSRIPSGEKSNLIVWNCLTAERVFESPAGPANSAVAFSPDGRRLAVGCDKPARVHVYDLASGTEQWRMDCSTVPFCLAFSPDGLTLALSGTHLELRDAQSGSLTRSLSPTVSRELSWHPDGGLLAAACGHDIEVWNTTTGQKHMVLRGHQDNVVGVRFVGKGNVIASRSWSSVGCLWDVWTGRPLLRWPDFSVFHRGWDTDGFFDMPAGTQARLWDTNLGTEFRALRSDRITSRHHEMAISPDGRWLAVAADEGVGLWDLDSEVQLAFLDIGRTTGVAFHPTGRRLYTTSLRALYEWPLEFPDHERMDIGPASKLAVPEPLWKAQLDRAGQMLCVAGAGGGFIVDPNEPTRVLTRFAHPNTTIIAVSPDGRWVATGTWNGLGLRVWNAQSGKLELELLPDGRRVNVIFSPDGQLLVASDHGDVYAWDTASWELRYRVDGSLGIAFSPDGSLLSVNNTAQRIRLLAARTGEEIATLEAPGEDILGGLKFARDGGRLYVSAGSPSRVCLWDLRQIRAGLAAIGLDWDLATLPPSPPNLRSRPIDVHIEWGNARPSVPRSAN
jgi:WD40 repeat protein